MNPQTLFVEGIFKESISTVQKVAPYFHGFKDDELEELFPFVTHFPFNDGDLLALKVVLAEASPIPTLVFDEVDSGVGGAVAGQ